MCGIEGYAGERQAASVLLEGLERLEYRGYDSAGIAVSNHGTVRIKKQKGASETCGKNSEKMAHRRVWSASVIRAERRTAIRILETEPMLLPLAAVIPVQLYAYYTAVCRGGDVDAQSGQKRDRVE